MAAPIQLASNGLQLGIQPQIIYQQPQIAGQNVFTQKRRERFAGEDKCKLFIGGLNYKTTDEEFKAYFSRFGNVIDSIIMIDKDTNKPRGFGFVTYSNDDEVEKLLSYEGPHIIDDRRLQVRKYFPKGEFQQKKFELGSTAAGAESLGMPTQHKMKISSDLKIFVGGIAPGTDEDDVRKYFSDFGTVAGVNMPRDHFHQHPRGFAFVGFETTDAIEDVTKNRYHQINGKTVEVKACDGNEQHAGKRDASRFSDQQRIHTVVPAVQAALPQFYQAAPQATALQYQLAGLGAAQPATTGGYTVIPAGYSYDPTTGMIYQAAVPSQLPGAIPGAASLAAAGQQLTSQQQQQQQQLIQLIQQQQLQQLQLAGQQYTFAAAPAGSTAATSAAQTAAAYQQIALGQYTQESSAFGAQRILAASGGAAPSTDIIYAAQPAAVSAADPNVGLVYAATEQRSSGGRTSFHPYGR